MAYNGTIRWFSRAGEGVAVGAVELVEEYGGGHVVVRSNGRQCTGHEGSRDYEHAVLHPALTTGNLFHSYSIEHGVAGYREALGGAAFPSRDEVLERGVIRRVTRADVEAWRQQELDALGAIPPGTDGLP